MIFAFNSIVTFCSLSPSLMKSEEKMEMLADISSVNSKKQLEYLFYGVDPNVPSELEHVIEEGFRSAEEAKKLGICPYVPLFNSILGVDLPRINHHVEFQQKNNKLGKSTPHLI